MRKFLWILIVALVVLGILACKSRDRGGEVEQFESPQKFEPVATEIFNQVHYITDPRLEPPVCFAYYWGGTAYGGPALATVPCGSVPPKLLVVANVPHMVPK